MPRIAVIGSFRMPPSRLADARPAMEQVITATRAEDGCIAYSYSEDIGDPGLIRVAELWESRQHLAAHFATPHMAHWAEVRKSFGLSERDITAYELGGSETL